MGGVNVYKQINQTSPLDVY